jgi:hypothetical protein
MRMAFHDRFSQPRDGHELIGISHDHGTFWCLRCGALWLDARAGHRATPTWETPGQAGSSHTTTTAPPCRPSTDAGAGNEEGDSRLMLRALTHGWRCEPVLLAVSKRTEAWRWSWDGPLGGEAWSVAGAWEDGPVIDATVRERLLVSRRGG